MCSIAIEHLVCPPSPDLRSTNVPPVSLIRLIALAPLCLPPPLLLASPSLVEEDNMCVDDHGEASDVDEDEGEEDYYEDEDEDEELEAMPLPSPLMLPSSPCTTANKVALSAVEKILYNQSMLRLDPVATTSSYVYGLAGHHALLSNNAGLMGDSSRGGIYDVLSVNANINYNNRGVSSLTP